MLSQPIIFKTPSAVSQATTLSKGCSSGYVTNVTYTAYGPKYEYCPSNFSCNPYGSSSVDASSTNSDGWTIAGAIGSVAGAIASIFT